MKFTCGCGELIFDSTDDLSHKGHLIPDERWNAMWDALDNEVIGAVARGHITKDGAAMHARQIVRAAGERLMYQCHNCGRLFIDDYQGQLHCFVPEEASTPKQLLRKPVI